MKTRSAFLEGAGKLTLVDRELELGEDEVLVETHQASICGTDWMLYQGLLPETKKYPIYLGHEGGGIVREVGKRVHEFKVDDRVAAFSHCNTFADFFKAKPSGIQKIPNGLDFKLGCLAEPLTCAIFSARHSGVVLGDSVAIFGVGFAGQVILQYAKKSGATTLFAIDISDAKLEMAKKMGADFVINSRREDPVKRIRDITKNRGVDVAVESASEEVTMNQATASLKHNGILVLYSHITRPITLNISRWHEDSIEIRSTGLVHHTAQEREVWAREMMRILEQNLLDIDSLTNREYKLENISRVFEEIDKREDVLKALILP
jgi:threonine dehydrogenase-like Zn-dependent dehydrogenase